MRLADLKDRSVAVWGTDAAARAAMRAVAAVRPSRLLAVDDRADYASIDWEKWWDAHYFDLTDAQRHAVWDALEKYNWHKVKATQVE